MSISVLYGRDISKDFTMEFNFATGRIGRPGAAWDGDFSLPSDSVLNDSGQIPENVVAATGISTDLGQRVLHSIDSSPYNQYVKFPVFKII